MSRRHRPDSARLSQYDSMDTEALQELLREDAKKNSIQDQELEVLLYILQILAQRDQRPRKSTEEAWEEFQRRCLQAVNPPELPLSAAPEAWLRRYEAAAWGICPPS